MASSWSRALVFSGQVLPGGHCKGHTGFQFSGGQTLLAGAHSTEAAGSSQWPPLIIPFGALINALSCWLRTQTIIGAHLSAFCWWRRSGLACEQVDEERLPCVAAPRVRPPLWWRRRRQLAASGGQAARVQQLVQLSPLLAQKANKAPSFSDKLPTIATCAQRRPPCGGHARAASAQHSNWIAARVAAAERLKAGVAP